jgi:hypothetical protein
MHDNQKKLVRFSFAILAVLAVSAGLSGGAYTQYRASLKSAWMSRNAQLVARAELERGQSGAPDDWSHRHLVFSNPGPEEKAIQNGRYDAWLRITNSARYIMQQKKRAAVAKPLANAEALVAAAGNPTWGFPIGLKGRPGKNSTPIHRDWAVGVGSGSPIQVNSPAKWSFDTTTASCANDFVVYPTGAAGAAGPTGQASIIAYFNLYTGCGGSVPSVAWAFNTGGTMTGAPTFSFDGTQLTFIQNTGGAATLVLLKLPTSLPGTGTLANPTTLATTLTPTTYPTCTAPCMLRITLNGSPTDTWSNPWIDYDSDTLFVGDDAGKLHRFVPVFNGTAGTPAVETISAGVWPVTLDASPLASPVFDSGSGKVFVGSGGGFFYAVGGGTPPYSQITSGHIYGTSTRLGPAAQTTEIEDAPIVDSNANMAYVFVQRDNATTANNAVFQFPTSFTSGSGTETTIGVFGATTEPVLSGALDNIYFNSESTCENGCTPTGSLYAAGRTTASATLYQIPITANVMGAANIGPVIGDPSFRGRTSPITEFFNSNGVTATGSVAISGNPAAWNIGGTRTVTIGTVTYTFVTTLTVASTPTAVQVLRVTNNVGANAALFNEEDTALNLEAAVNATPGSCSSGPPCFGTGTTANTTAKASNTGTSTIDTLTATTNGAAGNFTVTESGGGITVSSGTNGGSADYIFVSTYSAGNNGCTSGCVYSYNVSSGATITSALAPAATLPIFASTSFADGYATGAIVIDNAVTSTMGVSQIYFLTLNNGPTATCTTGGSRICATQASQSFLR